MFLIFKYINGVVIVLLGILFIKFYFIFNKRILCLFLKEVFENSEVDFYRVIYEKG